MHLNEFLIGNIAGLVFIKHFISYKKNYDWLIVLLSFIFVAILKLPLNLNFHNGLLALLFVPMIILISLNNGFITQLFKKKAFVFLGEISYGVYIIQYPLLLWCEALFKHYPAVNKTLEFYIKFILLIVLSAVSYWFFETPIRKRINLIKLR
jgi:hypothetical protein